MIGMMRNNRIGIERQQQKEVSEGESENVAADVHEDMLDGVDVDEADEFLGVGFQRVGGGGALHHLGHFVGGLVEACGQTILVAANVGENFFDNKGCAAA